MEWVGDQAGKDRWAVAVSAVRMTADLCGSGDAVTSRVDVRLYSILVRADNEWEAAGEAEEHVRTRELCHEPGWTLKAEPKRIPM